MRNCTTIASKNCRIEDLRLSKLDLRKLENLRERKWKDQTTA